MPAWPGYGPDAYSVLHLDTRAHAAPDRRRARYRVLDTLV